MHSHRFGSDEPASAWWPLADGKGKIKGAGGAEGNGIGLKEVLIAFARGRLKKSETNGGSKSDESVALLKILDIHQNAPRETV